MTDTSMADHVRINQRHWDTELAAFFAQFARDRWAAEEPVWGNWAIPQSRLPLLPEDVSGQIAVDLGCGTGYVSAWLAQRGAYPIGIDASAAQLATARRMQEEFRMSYPLLLADAERTPLPDGCADLVISEYGAAVWCDPFRWIPEAARLLRPGGRLVFLTNATLSVLCMPESGPVRETLCRPQFGLHRVTWPEHSGVEFYLSHGEWIRLLRSCGFAVEELFEVQAPEDDSNRIMPEVLPEWSRKWPSEEAWIARKG